MRRSTVRPLEGRPTRCGRSARGRPSRNVRVRSLPAPGRAGGPLPGTWAGVGQFAHRGGSADEPVDQHSASGVRQGLEDPVQRDFMVKHVLEFIGLRPLVKDLLDYQAMRVALAWSIRPAWHRRPCPRRLRDQARPSRASTRCGSRALRRRSAAMAAHPRSIRPPPAGTSRQPGPRTQSGPGRRPVHVVRRADRAGPGPGQAAPADQAPPSDRHRAVVGAGRRQAGSAPTHRQARSSLQVTGRRGLHDPGSPRHPVSTPTT